MVRVSRETSAEMSSLDGWGPGPTFPCLGYAQHIVYFVCSVLARSISIGGVLVLGCGVSIVLSFMSEVCSPLHSGRQPITFIGFKGGALWTLSLKWYSSGT